ncbi:hypothetical protein OAO01_06770 [Oligoflexia bacterium]|nr:hypothetical protein [Oligoflexia bacterium]
MAHKKPVTFKYRLLRSCGATLTELTLLMALIVAGLFVFKDALTQRAQEFHDDRQDFNYHAMQPLVTVPPTATNTATAEATATVAPPPDEGDGDADGG